MKKARDLAAVFALLWLLAACGLFSPKPTLVPYDPVRTLCGAIGLMHWHPEDSASTVKQVKEHNAVRRSLCPKDRYPEWYYPGLDAVTAPVP